jgi:hypothetical protein
MRAPSSTRTTDCSLGHESASYNIRIAARLTHANPAASASESSVSTRAAGARCNAPELRTASAATRPPQHGRNAKLAERRRGAPHVVTHGFGCDERSANANRVPRGASDFNAHDRAWLRRRAGRSARANQRLAERGRLASTRTWHGIGGHASAQYARVKQVAEGRGRVAPRSSRARLLSSAQHGANMPSASMLRGHRDSPEEIGNLAPRALMPAFTAAAAGSAQTSLASHRCHTAKASSTSRVNTQRSNHPRHSSADGRRAARCASDTRE